MFLQHGWQVPRGSTQSWSHLGSWHHDYADSVSDPSPEQPLEPITVAPWSGDSRRLEDLPQGEGCGTYINPCYSPWPPTMPLGNDMPANLNFCQSYHQSSSEQAWSARAYHVHDLDPRLESSADNNPYTSASAPFLDDLGMIPWEDRGASRAQIQENECFDAACVSGP